MSVRVRPTKRGFEVDILWRTPDGVRHRDRTRVSVTSKPAAQRWGQLREQQLMRDGPEKRKEVPTLRTFAERFMKEHAVANQLKPSGIAHKEVILRVHLLPRLGDRRLNNITNNDVQQLKYALRDKSAHLVNNVLTVLATMLKKAVEWQVLDDLPCTVRLLKKPPAKTKLLDFEQYEAVVAAAQAISSTAEVAVLLGGDAGLRAGEIRALGLADVDLAVGQLTVRSGEWHGVISSTKGNRTRFVPLTPRLTAALSRHRHLRGPLVLYRDNGEPMAEHHLADLIAAVARKAGVYCTPHVLRHTFCSHAMAAGVPVREIQDLAGHQDLKTMERYVHMLPGARHDAIRRLHAERQARRGEIMETPPRRSVSA